MHAHFHGKFEIRTIKQATPKYLEFKPNSLDE